MGIDAKIQGAAKRHDYHRQSIYSVDISAVVAASAHDNRVTARVLPLQ